MTEVPNTVKVLQDRDLLVKFPRLLIQLVGRTEYTKNAKKKICSFRCIFNRDPSYKVGIRGDVMSFSILTKLFSQSPFITVH